MDDGRVTVDDLRTAWALLSAEERLEALLELPTATAQRFFLQLPAGDQSTLLVDMDDEQRRPWLRTLPPDDLADLLQSIEPERRSAMLHALDDRARSEVAALLAYAEDDAGGLMSPRYARLRAEMSVQEAILYLRQQAKERLETIYYAYVLDPEQRLLGVVSLHELFASPNDRRVSDVMRKDAVTVRDDDNQETVARVLTTHDLIAVPVVDAGGRMRGIVTFDDVADAVQKETTEDMQKIAGVEALDGPYLQVGLRTMLRKRVGWLAVLFVSEMLTTTAMGHYQEEIEKQVVLATFVPLIISSGGNAGSQATTLVIRSLALGELRLFDVFRVLRREIAAGLMLGAILGTIGLVRIVCAKALFPTLYGENWLRLSLVVGCSVLAIVAWGSIVGAMLPFALKRLRLDPASASAPFVATLVDVSGVVIYFNVAWWILRGQFS